MDSGREFGAKMYLRRDACRLGCHHGGFEPLRGSEFYHQVVVAVVDNAAGGHGSG